MKDIYGHVIDGQRVRAHADTMPFDTRQPGAYLLTRIEVARGPGENLRGRGIASDLLRSVLCDADAEGVTLYLSIEPDGTGLNEDQLRTWYERHGFVADTATPSRIAMIRKPKEKDN